MNISIKLRVLDELISNVRDEILIKVGDMPEEWDGVELRWYVKEKFGEIVYGIYRDKRCKRYQDYKNYILTTGL